MEVEVGSWLLWELHAISLLFILSMKKKAYHSDDCFVDGISIENVKMTFLSPLERVVDSVKTKDKVAPLSAPSFTFLLTQNYMLRSTV